ncbi:hypothetical protein F5883DRAFT_558304 [Diaporthe sp. PMI_573]|nr:hypothetical protein F5883DRAFT_558304 [Diaporthaceae sp. PMI_573]
MSGIATMQPYFPTVTVLLPLPGIVARPQCHHGNARLETSFLTPTEPQQAIQPNPTYLIPSHPIPSHATPSCA